MEYGYARCSTNSDKQDINSQKRELILMGIKRKTYSGNMDQEKEMTGRSYNSFLKQ